MISNRTQLLFLVLKLFIVSIHAEVVDISKLAAKNYIAGQSSDSSIPDEINIIADYGFYAIPFQMGNAGLKIKTALKPIGSPTSSYNVIVQDCFCSGDIFVDGAKFGQIDYDAQCKTYSEDPLSCFNDRGHNYSQISYVVGEDATIQPQIGASPYGGGTMYVIAFSMCGASICCNRVTTCNYTIANPEALLSSSSCSSSYSNSCQS